MRGIGRRPARCFPFRTVKARWREPSRSTGRFVCFGRCTFGRVDRSDLARRIYTAAHLTGTFTLRSGVVSHEYFDKYRFESDPQLLADIAAASAALVPDGIDALAGLELGGVPLATMISQETRLPAVYVRKQAKTYGTCQLAEGTEIDGRRLCIVEDVVTSGGAILDAASELRARGARLGPVVCVIDRESGGREKLAADDLELFALYTMSELSAAAAAGA
jgi:orotate phosphoribosyltransferase